MKAHNTRIFVDPFFEKQGGNIYVQLTITITFGSQRSSILFVQRLSIIMRVNFLNEISDWLVCDQSQMHKA